MLVGVYSVRDSRNGFMAPSFENNDATAMRNFGNACLQKGTVLANFNADFELWKLGQFDTETGIFTCDVEERKPICSASDFPVK